MLTLETYKKIKPRENPLGHETEVREYYYRNYGVSAYILHDTLLDIVTVHIYEGDIKPTNLNLLHAEVVWRTGKKTKLSDVIELSNNLAQEYGRH